uniref:Uncharacterized protein n=1 Tax=Eucampia antarctica TaxID=49252 RepID=A0A7S2RJ09_9STRA
MAKQWDQGACGCTKDTGECCYVWCCPCLAAYDIAQTNEAPNPILYGIGVFIPYCGFLVWAFAGVETAKKAGIDETLGSACCKSCCACCTCYPCTVYHESKIYKATQSTPKQDEMER